MFDMVKLRWFNAEYLRAMAPEAFHDIALPWIKKGLASDLPTLPIARMIQPRTEVLSEIPEKLSFLNTLEDYDLEIYVHKKMKTSLENSLESLLAAVPVLEGIQDWNEENIHTAVMDLIAQMGIKNGQMLWPIRTAVSGWAVTPGGAIEIAEVLGKDETLRRIGIGIDRLKAAVGS